MKSTLIILFICCAFSIFAQKIILDTQNKVINLSPYTSIFDDSTSRLSLQEIQKQVFVAQKEKAIAFPFSDHTFWLKVNLENKFQNTKDWNFVWTGAMVEELNFYVPQADGTMREVKEGGLVFKEKNKFTENFPTTHFRTFDNKEHTYYVKMKSQRGHQAMLQIYSDEDFIGYNYNKIRRESFSNGLIILRFFYIVLLALFVIKDKVFKHYSFFIFFRSLSYWGILGLLGNAITTDTFLSLQINQMVFFLMPIAHIMVVKVVLDINRFPKFVLTITKTIPYLSLMLCLCIAIDYRWYWLKAATFLVPFTMLFNIILHIIAIVKKYKIDWVYSIPYLLSIMSTMYIPLRLLGMKSFPGSNEISYFIFISEILVFGLFLGRIIRNYERSKIVSQNELFVKNEEAFKRQALDQLKTNFFANISHEFRTPLTLILAPAQDLINENPNRGVYQIIHRNATRLLELINQLLDISKLEDGQMKLELEQTDLIKYFRTLISSFSSLAESKGIFFEFRQDKTSANGMIDRDKLEKIMTNLLSNAFKFTESGKKVTVNISYLFDYQKVNIEIKDEGIGISKAKLERIFDRFYQVDDGRNRKYEGTGIGLALVKELVNIMQGTIRVESEKNIGTSFYVSLPIEDMRVSPKEEVANVTTKIINKNFITESVEPVASEAKATSENILLVVDDNEDIRTYIRTVFEDNYQIIEAVNGKDGLRKATENIPDLIISDLMMPEMDGFELCANLKSDERTSHIPFILLTAKANVESRIEGLTLGADDYLIKPFNANEIKARVKNLIEKQEKLRQYFTGKSIELKPEDVKVNTMEMIFLNKATQIVEKYLSENHFGVEQFSQAMNMSASQLLRKLKALTNMTVNEFIRDFRLKRAEELLRKQSGTVSEIAFGVGFENLSYFSKMFQEKFGKLPSEYSESK